MKDWSTMPDEKTINSTAEAIRSRGINVLIAKDRKEALEKLKALIPKAADVMTGSSTTLVELGFISHLESPNHSWKNLHETVKMEADEGKRQDLRRRHVAAEYFLGSVNAISKDGYLVACDASGSRVSAYPFAAKHLILVAGAQKITGSLDDAMKRVREYVFPMENERAMKAYGMQSTLGKWVILEREIMPNRTTLVLVKERLGF